MVNSIKMIGISFYYIIFNWFLLGIFWQNLYWIDPNYPKDAWSQLGNTRIDKNKVQTINKLIWTNNNIKLMLDTVKYCENIVWLFLNIFCMWYWNMFLLDSNFIVFYHLIIYLIECRK